jgi:hypothetical protein
MSRADEAAPDRQEAVQPEEPRFREELGHRDREWPAEREPDAEGEVNRPIPTRVDSVIGGILVSCFGVVWTGLAALGAFHASRMLLGLPLGLLWAIIPWAVPCIGVLIVFQGISKSLTAHADGQKYKQALEEYPRLPEQREQ